MTFFTPLFSTSRRAAILAPGLAAILAAGCSGGGAGGPPPDVAVEVVMEKPAVSAVDDVLSAIGTIDANERVELKPKTSGAVETIHFVEGQRIEKGARLLDLDSRKESAIAAQAEAEEQLAKSNLARARTLAGTKAISLQEIDQLESQVAVRAAARDLERERLAERALTAPISGVLGPRLVSPGQYVAMGTPVTTIVDDSVVKVQFRIPERELGRVRTGQEGRLRVASQADRVFVGQVDLIDPEVDSSTRTAMIRLRVSNPDGLLRPGMFARVELVTSRRDRALVLPEGALVPAMDRFSVFVSDQGRAASRTVKLGVRLPGKVEILEGITAETEVVVSGTQKLVEGMKVVPAKPAVPAPTGAKPPQPAAHP
jgi:membrane fusion protein (multidrug efflux system)